MALPLDHNNTLILQKCTVIRSCEHAYTKLNTFIHAYIVLFLHKSTYWNSPDVYSN